MSKFEELRQAYITARKNSSDYWKTCWGFASDLVNRMIDYFQWPREQVKVIPLKGDVNPNLKYTVQGSMHLGDDAFWHLGVNLFLYEAPNIHPYFDVLLPVMIKKVDDHFIVKLEGYEKEFKIHKDNPDGFNAFYEFIFEQIKKRLQPSHKNETLGGVGLYG